MRVWDNPSLTSVIYYRNLLTNHYSSLTVVFSLLYSHINC
jgi:hypothetical protein